MTDTVRPHPSPAAYRQRDLAICRLTGLYAVSITESVNATLGGGKHLGHIVRRLAESGELTLHSRALEGGVSYCQLTEHAAERLGVPSERTKPLGTQALDKALAVLVWCTLASQRRYRLERALLGEVLPGVKFPTNQVHCVSEEAGERCLWRVMLVQGHHEPVLKALTRDVMSAMGTLRHALEHQQYGFALLVDTVVKQQQLEAAIQRSGLCDSARICVDVSATSQTLAAYLRRMKAKSSLSLQ